MKICWSIDKKRGNYRPTLQYTITLEAHERAIAVDSLRIESTIPRIPTAGRSWCLPGQDERAEGWQPTEFHSLTVPWFKVGESSDVLRLPFRDSGLYPEVEASFARLRSAWEEVVRTTWNWEPLAESGMMETSEETKSAIAARLAAMQMLSFGGKSKAG